MTIVNCKKCNSLQVKGCYTDIDINYDSLCMKCYNKEYYKKNKQKFLDAASKKYKENKKECLAGMKLYAEKNKEKLSNYQKEYYQKNYNKVREGQKNNYQKNSKKYNKAQYLKKKEKMKTDTYLKLCENLRSRIGMAIKNYKGTKHTPSLELLGAPINVVREHIENQFQDGMNWENHGVWHIDHIVPCAFFDLTKLSHQKFCFHYENLQPLWALDNIRKKDSIL